MRIINLKRSAVVGVLVGAVLTTGVAGRAATYGLAVGVGDYQPGRGISDVPSCRAGATTFRSYLLRDTARWSASNFALLLDEEATEAAILDALSDLANQTGAGDTVVYYHSGHGGQSSGKDTFLCAYDKNLHDVKLAAALDTFGDGVDVIILIDSCHASGMFVDGMTTASSAPLVPWRFAENVMQCFDTPQMRTTSSGASIYREPGLGHADMAQRVYKPPAHHCRNRETPRLCFAKRFLSPSRRTSMSR